ncbi:MAG: ATP-binding protein [Actinomycetota bacterium]|nr:ATP-binding protein [Actinomycetota bacterium]
MVSITTPAGGEGGGDTPSPAPAAVRRIALPVRPGSCAVARHFVRSVLAGSGWAGDVEAAVLLTSELVANAFIHAHSPCYLTVRLDGSRVRVEASDTDPDPPVVARPSDDSPGGRGLVLVEALSSAWGSRIEADEGKTIWFELAVRARQPSRGARARRGPSRS